MIVSQALSTRAFLHRGETSTKGRVTWVAVSSKVLKRLSMTLKNKAKFFQATPTTQTGKSSTKKTNKQGSRSTRSKPRMRVTKTKTTLMKMSIQEARLSITGEQVLQGNTATSLRHSLQDSRAWTRRSTATTR